MATQHQKFYDIIVELRSQGLTYKQIAAQLGISHSRPSQILKMGPPGSTPKRKPTVKCTKTKHTVGESEHSRAVLISSPSYACLRIESTDSSLASYLVAHGKEPSHDGKQWIYEDHPQQLLLEIPALQVFFSSWDLPPEFEPHTRTRGC